ncbi:MFS transporter [Streptomyces sp. NPDC004647]|uniref:MFS transporter n=1 Tax=Streptomyces sp. NPDC004647 TaxID=3154671 RepID=UPI0033A447D2
MNLFKRNDLEAITTAERRNPGALAILLLASTLTIMAGAILSPVVEVIRNDLGVNGTRAGLVLTAHGLAIAVSSPLIGWMIDRWGVRVPLAAGLVLYGVAGGAGLFTTSYPALLASRFVFGIGAAAVFSGTTVAMLSLYRGAELDRVMGWRVTAVSLGGVLWPLLGGALGGLSWHAPFAVYALGVPIGIAALLTLPGARAEGLGRSRSGGMLTLLRRYPALLGFYGLMLASGIMLYGLIVFLPQQLAQAGVEHPVLVSFYTMSVSGAMSLVGLVYVRIRANLNYSGLLRLSVAPWLLAFLILGTTDQPVLLLLAPLLYGIGNGIAFPALTVLIGETPPAELRGQATALSGTATFAGQFLSPLLVGPLIGELSLHAGFLVLAGFAAVLLLILLLVKVPAPGAERAEPEPTERTGKQTPVSSR